MLGADAVSDRRGRRVRAVADAATPIQGSQAGPVRRPVAEVSERLSAGDLAIRQQHPNHRLVDSYGDLLVVITVRHEGRMYGANALRAEGGDRRYYRRRFRTMRDKELQALIDEGAAAAEAARGNDEDAPLLPHVKVSRPNLARSRGLQVRLNRRSPRA